MWRDDVTVLWIIFISIIGMNTGCLLIIIRNSEFEKKIENQFNIFNTFHKIVR